MSKYMIIDGIEVEFSNEKNILQVIKKAGIHIPTFCYYEELSVYGACRMCVVEDERGNIIASCSTPPKDRMSIKTNTPRLYHHRKMILELLLSSHCRDCTICEKNQKCRLQMLAARFGITKIRFDNKQVDFKIDESSYSIVKNQGKCILCGNCVRMCNDVQRVGAIDFIGRGSKMMVGTAYNKPLAQTKCVNCGQCVAVCPTGALIIKNNIHEVKKAIYDKNTRVVVQVAPAVRVAIGEEFGFEPGIDCMGKIYTALRMLGFDIIFDTSVTADITIMEETKELLDKISNGNTDMPLFTSCCPAWIRFVETKYPQLLPYISTCKSPMQMFGAIIKDYYKQADKEAGLKTCSVAIMPCTAKKYEAKRSEFIRNNVPDVDIVLTTQELISMIKELGINFSELKDGESDMPFSEASGAGVIFGVTGGVTQAALRKVENTLGDVELRIATVSGLGNADTLIKKILSGEEHYDLVEVMACPSGCVAGAGQPYAYAFEKEKRGKGLYVSDEKATIHSSEENPVVNMLYKEGMLKDEQKAHELLHVKYI